MQPRAIARILLMTTALVALWFILCWNLSSEWSLNEQYNYGWFVPFFALYLFWLRWQDRPEAEARSQKSEVRGRFQILIAAAIGIAALLLLLPIRLFEIANPDWRPLGWVHAVLVVTLTLILIWNAGGSSWLKHFAFPVAFFFVAVPWISPIEQPIVEGLMRVVASAAAETVSLFGIPAQVEGNLIRVNTGLVGVNEACSGVRSLQTALMIGLLFGELKRLSILRRIALVAGAVAIALIANFLRTFFLVWVAATKNISEVDRWHDLAGYLIIALVFVGSLALAAQLSRNKVKNEIENRSSPRPPLDRLAVARRIRPAADQRSQVSFLLPNFYFLLCALVWLFLVEISAGGWYRTHEKDLVAYPGWNLHWPNTAPAFREIKINEDVRSTLRFDEGRQAGWLIDSSRSNESSLTPSLPPLRCIAFFFRWKPGSSSVLRARAHGPDICLPSAGWRQVSDRGTKNYFVTANFFVPFHHATFQQDRTGMVAHTFFCLQEDRLPRAQAQPEPHLADGAQPDWSYRARTHAVLSGVRNLGQQVMECVLIPTHEIDDSTAETKFSEVIRTLIVPAH